MRNTYAVLASFNDLNQIKNLVEYDIITFKESISNALDYLNVRHIYVPLSIYSDGNLYSQVYDIVRLWRIVYKAKILIFPSHDCLGVALAVKFSKHVKFRNNYPHVDLTGARHKLSLSNFIFSKIFNIKLELIDDNGILSKSFNNLIMKKAKIEKIRFEPVIFKFSSNEPRLIFVCDDNFCRDPKYTKSIIEALNLLKKRNIGKPIFIKIHPKNNNNTVETFGITNKLPTDIPVELLISKQDILIGFYSSLFERYQESKIISIIDIIKPYNFRHIELKKHMKYRLNRIRHEKL